MATHPSALRKRLCPYSICFLDVYLVCHGDGLTTERRQPREEQAHHPTQHNYTTETVTHTVILT